MNDEGLSADSILEFGEDFKREFADYCLMNDCYMSVFFRDDLTSMQCALRVILGKSDLKEVSVDLADKEHIIYVNGSCRGGDTALGRLMQDFSAGKLVDMRYDELRKRTKELKGLGCKEGNTSDVIREMVEKGIE